MKFIENMDPNEFRKRGHEMIDYIVDYLENISQRHVVQNVPQNYLKSVFPAMPPKSGDSFQEIMEDIEKYIMPGLIHWQHPGFHAFLPASSSFPDILANMIAEIFCVGSLNWDYSPCGSELEIVVLNWYGKMIGLPESFLNLRDRNRGAGVLENSTTECIFLSMVTARRKFLMKLKQQNPSISSAALLLSLVAYCSKEGHACIEKISLLTLVNIRVLGTDKDNQLRGETLDKAMESDMRIGLIPFFVNISLGASSCGSCDPISEIGPVCEKYDVWLNVDASYAGPALVCPEYRHLLDGIKYASSFNSSPANWMHVDSSVLFVKDRFELKHTSIVDRTMFGYAFNERDWAFPSTTENHGIKYLFVLRSYGVEGLQKRIRDHIRLAELFEDCVRSDKRFEFVSRQFGIVCFRLTGTDALNKCLNSAINATGQIFMSPIVIHKRFLLRFLVCIERSCEDDITYAWKVICEQADEVLNGNVKMIKDNITDLIYDEMCQIDIP